MKTYVVDAGSWIEYLKGTDKGSSVRELVEAQNTVIITAESTVAELFSWSQQHKFSFPRTLETITARSRLQEIYLNSWIEAMAIRSERRKARPKFGVMDALIVAVAATLNATVITTDTDFKGMKNVVVL